MAEGIRSVEALIASSMDVRGVLVGPQLTETARGAALVAAARARGVEVAEVDERSLASAAQTDSPQGVLAVGAIPTWSWSAVPNREPLRIVLLDAIQDPGNVGTIVRTAAALGAAAVVALPGTVDLWNAKVVRSGMGTHFTNLVFASDWQSVDAWRTGAAVPIWGTDAEGEPLPDVKAAAPSRLAVAFGNEGMGLTPEARSRASRLVSLPIGGVESLNVAIAAGIVMYELRP